LFKTLCFAFEYREDTDVVTDFPRDSVDMGLCEGASTSAFKVQAGTRNRCHHRERIRRDSWNAPAIDSAASSTRKRYLYMNFTENRIDVGVV